MVALFLPLGPVGPIGLSYITSSAEVFVVLEGLLSVSAAVGESDWVTLPESEGPVPVSPGKGPGSPANSRCFWI